MQVELAHIADPAIGAALTERGYRLTSFENVLGLELAQAPEHRMPDGVEVRRSGDEEFAAWMEVIADGVVAGGASFRVSDGVADLAGAATAPAYRRRCSRPALPIRQPAGATSQW